MSKRRITCAILAYNYGNYLGEAIDSCLAQQPGDYERDVLVLDDGSTDNTPEVCARYGATIRVSRTPNQGFGPTLTRAVREATGDYVALLDADDRFAPEKLTRLAEKFGEGVIFVKHDMVTIDERGVPTGAGEGGNTSTLAFSRAAALDVLPVTNELFFHLLGEGGSGAWLREPLCGYRIHSRSMTDRSATSMHARYFARTKLETAAAGRRLLEVRPAWLRDAPALRRACAQYECLGETEELEACLNERNLGAAIKAGACMLGACARYRLLPAKSVRMLGRFALRTIRGHYHGRGLPA